MGLALPLKNKKFKFVPKAMDKMMQWMFCYELSIIIFSYTLKRTFWTGYFQDVPHDNFHETHVIITPCHFPEAG